MIMNTLSALALGFVLDMALGDPSGDLYPLTLIKKLVKSLEGTLRKAYADSPEAQNMAGIMLVVMTLIICLGSSAALLFICYKLSVVLGIVAEGVLCWISMSTKFLRTSLQGVFRSAKANSVPNAQRYLKRLTTRDVVGFDMDECVRCAVEEGAENTVDWVIGPIFWICLLGGIGGIFCRAVNVLDNTVGFKSDDCRYFGRVPARLDDVVMFLPARIAAGLMRMDVSFLKLDSRGAAEIYKRDKDKSLSPNSGCTQAVAAGALNIRLGCDGVYRGHLVKRQPIGDDYHTAKADEIFWINQLIMGTAANGIMLAAIFRSAAYLISIFLIK